MRWYPQTGVSSRWIFIGIEVLVMVLTMGDRIFANAGNGVQTAAGGGGRRR